MQKICSIIVVLIFILSLSSCGNGGNIGVITLGDEKSLYDAMYIEGIKEVMERRGIEEQKVIWKYNVPEGEECFDIASELAEQGCTVIFSNSYGHEEFMARAAAKYPETTFVAANGNSAVVSKQSNLKNASPSIHEARYVSGVVAGMKINELIEKGKLTAENYDHEGNIKIGYVGSYIYPSIVSGYTSFYLGVKSVCPKVTMSVDSVASWYDEDLETESAQKLIVDGCVIIGQHSTSSAAAVAAQSEFRKGGVAYAVGFGRDLRDEGPDVVLTSAQSNWDVYYDYAINNAMRGKEISSDWSGGYEQEAVSITELGKACTKGTQNKVDEVVAGIKDGSIKVFDINSFTVNGKKVTSYKYDTSVIDYSTMQPIKGTVRGEEYEAIDNREFMEAEFKSSPYFDLMIDGIVIKE